MKRTILIAVLALVLVPMMAGCQQTTVDDAKSDFCVKLEAVGTAVDGLGQMTATSTVEELNTARAEVDTAWTELQAASTTLEETQLEATQGAVDELMGFLDGIQDDATLNQAFASVVAGATATRAQIDTINTTLCVTVPAADE